MLCGSLGLRIFLTLATRVKQMPASKYSTALRKERNHEGTMGFGRRVFLNHGHESTQYLSEIHTEYSVRFPKPDRSILQTCIKPTHLYNIQFVQNNP